jgi:sugar O-acyltransferase (sialic acid O-acetyltransferase NeuD family)
MHQVVIVGAGGFGREVHDVLLASGRGGEFAGFVDDGDPDLGLLAARGAPYLGPIATIEGRAVAALIGIGDPRTRARVDEWLTSHALLDTSAIHPAATFGEDNRFEPGLVVCAHVSITTNIALGRHVHVNLNATIGHDCRIGDYVTINPGANISGNVTIGDRVMVGTGAAIIQDIRIGAGTTVGAGAVVTRDLPPGVIAVGAPARPVRDVPQ